MTIIILGFSTTFFILKSDESESSILFSLSIFWYSHTTDLSTISKQFYQVFFCNTVRKITYVYCVLFNKTKSRFKSFNIQIWIIKFLKNFHFFLKILLLSFKSPLHLGVIYLNFIYPSRRTKYYLLP